MFKQIYKRFTYNQSYFTLEKQLFGVLLENKYLKKENENLQNKIKTNIKKKIEYNIENTFKNYDKCYNKN